MNREIEFRGLTLDNKWVYGYLLKKENGFFIYTIYNNNYKLTWVRPETIGQFTGRTDFNGIKIYELDLIKDKYNMEFVVILEEEENRYTGVKILDYIYKENQGDIRYIRSHSIEEHQLIVYDDIFHNEEYLKYVKEKESNE